MANKSQFLEYMNYFGVAVCYLIAGITIASVTGLVAIPILSAISPIVLIMVGVFAGVLAILETQRLIHLAYKKPPEDPPNIPPFHCDRNMCVERDPGFEWQYCSWLNLVADIVCATYFCTAPVSYAIKNFSSTPASTGSTGNSVPETAYTVYQIGSL